jgi:hypothetical protein
MFGYTKYRRIILADSQAMYKTSTVIVFFLTSLKLTALDLRSLRAAFI